MKKNKNKSRLREIISIGSKYGFKGNFKDPKDLRYLLEDLGPTFVKIGQILSTRPDLLPTAYTEELKNLQDNVSSGSFAEIKNIIEKNLGDIGDYFIYFDQTPIASASISEVFNAKLLSGENVVVKVQRPNVKETMYADLEILKKLAPFINIGPTRNLLDMKEIVEELETAIKKELDFLTEVKNINTFREFNENRNSINAPMVYSKLSSEKILVMEKIDGRKISDKSSLLVEGYDIDDIAKKLTYNFFQQIFDDGFFHADPHPGNIFIWESKIYYIDFGLMGQLKPYLRKNLNAILEAAVKKDMPQLSKSVLAIGIVNSDINFNSFQRDIESMYDKYIDEALYNFNIGEILNEIIVICRENNISMPKEMTLLSKSLITIQGVLADLSDEISLIDIALPFFKERYFQKKLEGSNPFKSFLNISNNLENIYNTPININNLLKKAYDGNLEFNLQINSLESSLSKLDLMVNRIVAAIIIVGILISSGLVVRIPHLRFIASIGYFISIILGIILVVSIIRHKKY